MSKHLVGGLISVENRRGYHQNLAKSLLSKNPSAKPHFRVKERGLFKNIPPVKNLARGKPQPESNRI
jgi:hypothetical protein